MFLILAPRRRTALNNLTIAFGNSKSDSEKIKIALESFRNLITSFMEFFRLPKFINISAKHILSKGDEHLDNAFARGKGLILAMSHLGPWEYLGVFGYLKKYPSAIMGRALRNPYIYRRITALRKTAKLDHIDKDAGLKAVFSKLRQNHGVAIAIDQWAGNEGIWIDFFGAPTSTTSFPARIAKKTGCAIVPAYCIRVASGKYEIHVEPGITFKENENNWVENTTKKLNLLLEQKIRAYPGQWSWAHKRWKNKRHIKPVKNPLVSNAGSV